jgi:hypothetical protein
MIDDISELEDEMYEILVEANTMVTVEELRSFMNQALSRGANLDSALRECFRAPAPIHAAPACKKMFAEVAGRFWDALSADYDATTDSAVAALRNKVLTLSQRQADWIRSLDMRGIGPEDLPSEQTTALGEIGAMLSSSLEVIERDAPTDALGSESLLATLEQIAPVIDGLIAEIESIIAEPGSPEKPWDPVADMEPQALYVVKVTLEDFRPPIWRRIQIPGNAPLHTLHEAIQASMGWYDAHLHAFMIDDSSFTDPDMTDDLDDFEDEYEYTIDSLGLREKKRFKYVYDFGDNWAHTIVVERVIPIEEYGDGDPVIVRCLKGKRAGPAEDTGGPFGYARLLLLREKSPDELDEYDREMLENFGEDFDPEAFDIDEVNEILEKLNE